MSPDLESVPCAKSFGVFISQTVFKLIQAESGNYPASESLTQADFVCVSCGHTDDADVNAAINILRAGHSRLACGEVGAVRPLDEAGTPE